jgi:hypothetical protein
VAFHCHKLLKLDVTITTLIEGIGERNTNIVHLQNTQGWDTNNYDFSYHAMQSRNSHMAIFEIPCKKCGDIMYLDYYLAKTKKQKFCSRACSGTTKRRMSRNPKYASEYAAWKGMKQRCTNKNNPQYHLYGGRGIKVCKDFMESFEKFFDHIGKSPGKGYSVDRIKNNLNYDYGNIKWSTDLEQSNNKRNCIYVKINGVKKTVTQWCREFGLNKSTVLHRISRGAKPKDALKHRSTHKKIEINGESKHLTEWCRIYQTERGTVYQRVSRGWNKIEAIITPTNRENSNKRKSK